MRTTVLCLCAVSSAMGGALPGAPGERMVVTVGNDVGWQVISPEEATRAFRERGELRCGPERLQAHWDARGKRYVEHGATAFEPYVKWMLMEPREGEWDPSFYDAELAAIKANGLRWVPFLIAGPAYATPPWFKESDESLFARDLRTGDVSRDQSIWNPHLKPRVRAWLERFFAHYRGEDMQAVLLGISGVFGESIYTAGGNVWTHIWDGVYPQHLGWWCGDAAAEADFRRVMAEKYGTVTALNRAWGTELASLDDVAPFVPDGDRTDRARLDLVRWYTGSMTDFAEWWVVTVRELAPSVPVLLCTGGGAQPELGADMGAQTRMVARHGAGMRITNEASNYAVNFHLTRHVGSAARLYGTYFGYEPAGAVDENGITARIYNAVASGAWELFHYDNPPGGTRGARYTRDLDLMVVRKPVVQVGMLWPRTSADLGLVGGLGALGGAVRDRCDVDYVDEGMISDGVLSRLRVLVWGAGNVIEASTAQAIKAAVMDGLALVVPSGWRPRSPEGDPVYPSGLTKPPERRGSFAVTELPFDDGRGVPGRTGIFHGPEPDGVWRTSGMVCWTSGTVSLRVPVPQDRSVRVRLPYLVGNLDRPVRFLSDRKLVHQAPAGQRGEVVVNTAVEAQQRGYVTLTVEAATWSPADGGESTDTRKLSVMLRDVLVGVDGGRDSDAPVVRAVTREGRGQVVEAAGASARDAAAALGDVLQQPDRYGVAGLLPETGLDAEADRVYLSVTETDLLYLNHGDEPRTVRTPDGPREIPPHTIVTVPRGRD